VGNAGYLYDMFGKTGPYSKAACFSVSDFVLL